MSEEGASGSGSGAGGNVPTDDKISLLCQQNGAEVHFKVRKNMPFRKLMEAYAERQGRAVSDLRFTFEGQRLQPDAVPEDLDMEDGDIIDIFEEQVGGGRF